MVRVDARSVRHAGVLLLVALLTAPLLVLTVSEQIYDSNHYALTVATALLAGDHPYRDFYDPGAPLAGYLSAAVQVLSGHRLLGEFVKQWVLIVAGMVLSFHLALRLSRSLLATLLVLPLTLFALLDMPTYHYSKLFFFPLALLCAWRYVERPGVRRAVVLAVVAVVAFFYRHDYGVYVGALSIAACILARAAHPEARSRAALTREVGAYGLTVVVLLAPWAVVVQANEGLVPFVQSRLDQYQSPRQWAYWSLLDVNPVRTLRSEPVPPREETVDLGTWRPARVRLQLWLQQMVLLTSILLLLRGALAVGRARGRLEAVPMSAWHTLLAGVFLVVIDSALTREPSYAVVLVPLTAALGAPFLAPPGTVRRACAGCVLAFTTLVAFVLVSHSALFRPWGTVVRSTREAFAQLTASPPDYGYFWFTYLRDCTTDGDRLLVTGSTPLHVSYYTGRPIAGGHINWRLGWRSSPREEAESLALLERQSVPFVISTSDPALIDFIPYPRIHEYLVRNYVPVEGSNDRVLVDRNRPVVSRYGDAGLPCFR